MNQRQDREARRMATAPIDTRCGAWLHVAGEAPRQCTRPHEDHDKWMPPGLANVAMFAEPVHVAADGLAWLTVGGTAAARRYASGDAIR
jgi:hypothetical protein